MAIWGIKRSLIVQQIAEEQGFEVSKEEVDERVKSIAERLGRPVGQVRAKLAKSGELRDIERGLVEAKVFDYLREASEIKGAS
jgi:trigger factor